MCGYNLELEDWGIKAGFLWEKNCSDRQTAREFFIFQKVQIDQLQVAGPEGTESESWSFKFLLNNTVELIWWQYPEY